MIDSGGINRINPADYINQIKQTNKVQKPETQAADDSIFKTENLEKSAGIKSMLKEAERIPEVREKLVNHFRELIRNDAYNTDTDKILNKILGE
ncbi:MAG TPA: flagellar biosynthesis anti-sigma factor FlgM [Thermotogota bacterium]|nr:flagellar biosynthesis anti-sigma factor FlgM [Thermotogota bacterium]HPJ88377.1 flagellar biosynthesis anti-sigma factor FlgM [Thermotogota bacterium]HPR95455.1 flagellar biosynthesis anti-sigma factor FlgM [Thermotogota bacterium]